MIAMRWNLWSGRANWRRRKRPCSHPTVAASSWRITRAVSWLARPRNVAMSGIDGLYLVGNTLIAMQNGTTPMRVVRMRLDRALTRVERSEPVESNTPALGTPTHGVVADGDLYFIANSGWDKFTDEGLVQPGVTFEAPAILKMRLRP